MRLTSVLCRQHIGWHFKKHWLVQGRRRVLETGTEAALAMKGIEVTDPKKYLLPVHKKITEIRLHDIFEKPKKLDETHPDYKAKGLYLFGDTNVVVNGIPQTQVLLKTLVFDEFPEQVEDRFQKLKLPADIERSMQQSCLVSHLLDAEQKKTEKIVNPLRPMRPYPRNYGITEARKNMLLSTRLLNHCERFYGHVLSSERKTVNDAMFIVPFSKNNDKIQLELTAETFMTTKKPISAFKVQVDSENVLPDIFPLKDTVSIPLMHFYDEQSVYPIKASNAFSHPHTMLLHYSKLDVKNLSEIPVTPTQLESRAMLKGFAACASRAQNLYGADVKTLEKPIVVQVVQFKSQKVQFGIFQLNTLDLTGSDGVKNYWFRKPIMELYKECHYDQGRPALTSYNFDVFRLMSVFYSN